MKINRTKKWIVSLLFATPLLTLPISLNVKSSKSDDSVKNIKTNLNDNVEKTNNENYSKYIEDAKAVADSSVTNFKNYIVSYSDKNISPVTATLGSEDTNIIFSTMIGMTENKQTITSTTYDGVLLWSNKLTENKLLKQYYVSKNVDDISNFKVVNYLYLKNKEILFVLFGEEKTEENNLQLQNLVVLGLDIKFGSVFVPGSANLENGEIINSVKDNAAFIFANSKDQLIVTSANTTADINKSSKIISFDEKEKGFATIKESSDSSENPFYSQVTNTVKKEDMLLGFVPSNTPGVNYSLWLYTVSRSSTGIYLDFVVNNKTINLHVSDKYPWGAFNYYIVPVNDNFENINNKFFVANEYTTGITTHTDRGYITDTKNPPKFSDINKRFYNMGVDTTNGLEYLTLFMDSYIPIISTVAQYSFYIKDLATNPTGTRRSRIFYNSGTQAQNNLTNFPKASDFANVPDVDNWNINTIGYDDYSKTFYYSYSGNKKYIYKYINAFAYIKLYYGKNGDIKTTFTNDNRAYTITNVNSYSYQENSDTKNAFVIKQYLDDNDNKFEWLSRLSSSNDAFTLVENNKVSFSKLPNNLKDQITSKDILIENNKMPSALTETDLENIISKKVKLNNNRSLTVKNIVANDETGDLSFSVDLVSSNDLNGNKVTLNYPLIEKVEINGGYKLDDFVLSFKNDNAVNDIKTKYSLDSIINNDNKGFVIKNFLQDAKFLDKQIVITDSMVALNAINENTLEIVVSIPIKSETNTNGILPIGFPKELATKKMIYSGFSETNNLPKDDAPENNLQTNINNNDVNLSNIEFAGIAIGFLIFASIIIAIIVFLSIKPVKKTKIILRK